MISIHTASALAASRQHTLTTEANKHRLAAQAKAATRAEQVASRQPRRRLALPSLAPLARLVSARPDVLADATA